MYFICMVMVVFVKKNTCPMSSIEVEYSINYRVQLQLYSFPSVNFCIPVMRLGLVCLITS